MNSKKMLGCKGLLHARQLMVNSNIVCYAHEQLIKIVKQNCVDTFRGKFLVYYILKYYLSL